MSIFTLLKDDHDSLRESITAVQRAKGQDRKIVARHYDELALELMVHHEAEQHVLFSHLARLESLGDQALHAVEEHGEHRKLIEMMQDTPSFGDEWWNSFDELAHDSLHHLDEEEEDIFPLAEKNLHSKTIQELGQAYGASKGGHKTHMQKSA